MKLFSLPLRWRCLILLAGLTVQTVRAEQFDWYRFSVNEDQLQPVVDFSGLNRPITAADRVFVRQAHFYTTGADRRPNTGDDKRLRFFGISLSAADNFPDEQGAVKLAKRLRRLGFNAVRLHHLDTTLSDDTSKPQGILTTGAYPSFNHEAIRRLRLLIDACKNEGIYVNLNLHVGYAFRPAVDQITPLFAGERMPFASQPMHMFEPRMQALQVEYAQQLLRRLQLNDDPVLAMVEINNESSLVGAWQRQQIDQLKGEYQRILQLQWQRWIQRQYGSIEQACVVWHSCSLPKKGGLLVSLQDRLILEQGDDWTLKAQDMLRRVFEKFQWTVPAVLQRQHQLPDSGLGRRVIDFLRFLSESDKQYLELMKKTVRAEVGNLVPVAGTQAYYGGLLNVDSHVAMDYVDEHVYVDHYQFPGKEWDRNDWKIRDQSALKDGWHNLLSRAYYRDARKPFVISEFNQAYPNRQSAEIIPVMATLASMQDWDGLFFFQYGDVNLRDPAPDSFSLTGHSGQLVTTGLSSSLFRQFQLQPNPDLAQLALPANVRLSLAAQLESVNPAVYPGYLRANMHLSEDTATSRRIAMDFAAMTQSKIQSMSNTTTDAEHDAEPGAEVSVRAPGQQLVYQREQPQLWMQNLYGALQLGVSDTANLNLKILKPQISGEARKYATFLMGSRDGLPLKQSRRLLLVASGATTASQGAEEQALAKKLIPYNGNMIWKTLEPDVGLAGKPSGSRDGVAPVWMERIVFQLFVPSAYPRIEIYPLDEKGSRLPPLLKQNIQQVPGGFQVNFNQRTPWYEIVLSPAL
ncbi:cellulase family glycosylhydrolase [Undibacterium rugosum]|uniref:Cellulase family glycosylhydrolase n=1 Tax=Undibacterium rugosum TaxID=2762291 RepID=A0A923KZ19_9BURK|nr:cellulase family glycosylhydrolase [Undibacterium rugosum]MBC3935360.1 cellulase family glycosylhydrolase [Undibacterium rugosum]MBR7778865.1 cellulase family glycosylhydrolase [Undibacterium rugosum]